jgi:hypothetical protein
MAMIWKINRNIKQDIFLLICLESQLWKLMAGVSKRFANRPNAYISM